MKNFLEYLTEADKTYEFRIKLANIDVSEYLEKLRNALDSYGLEKLGEAKRLPIKANDIDFPSMPNVEIHLIDVILSYPVNDAQLRAIISERAGIPQCCIVVVSPNSPEEIWRWDLEGNELREYVQGEAVLDKPLEDNPEGKAAGKVYAEAGTLLKELSKFKIEFAGTEKADGKTSNDLAQSTTSPIKGQ
jgi:hypothetical protein